MACPFSADYTCGGAGRNAVYEIENSSIPATDEYKRYSFAEQGDNWQLVRRTAGDGKWHPATDRLSGTDEYGTFVDDRLADSTFSRYFSDIPHTEYLFTTGDMSHWLIATRSAVTGEFYTNQPREIVKSSIKPIAYTARWYNRDGRDTDPLVTLNDWPDLVVTDEVLYIEGSFPHYATATTGYNVFLR